MDFLIRSLTLEDEPFLWEMLYQAIYLPEGVAPFPREILQQPDIRRYVQDWGRAGDAGTVAVETGAGIPIGAAWVRLWRADDKGYGYVDAATPELSVALLPGYRGGGVGTRLIERLLQEIDGAYPAVSLSVSAENPAVRLYQRLGFEPVSAEGTSLVMVRRSRQ